MVGHLGYRRGGRDQLAPSRAGRWADGHRRARHGRARGSPAGPDRSSAGGPARPDRVDPGIGLAIVAVVFVSRVSAGEASRRQGLGLALTAGAALGTFNITIAHLTTGLVFGPLTIVRGVEALLVVLLIFTTRSFLASLRQGLASRPACRRARHVGERVLHSCPPGWPAGYSRGAFLTLSGHDGHPRRRLSARANHRDACARYCGGRGSHLPHRDRVDRLIPTLRLRDEHHETVIEGSGLSGSLLAAAE